MRQDVRATCSTYVIVLMGLPGAGKSTLAVSLQRHLPVALLDRDAIRQSLFPDCQFSGHEKDAAQAQLLQLLAQQCARGQPSLLDGATFTAPGALAPVRAIVRDNRSLLLPLWLTINAEEACRRVAADARAGAHVAADRTPGLVRRLAALAATPPADAIVLAATRPAPQLAAAALATIRARVSHI